LNTIHNLAARVMEELKGEWARSEPETAINFTEKLGPSDVAAVRQVVSSAGYKGSELDEMVKLVSARVVTQVQALSDTQPATGAD
jgi:hypothetical protein